MSTRRPSTAGWPCFDVRWLGEPLSAYRTPSTLPVSTSSWYEMREAARFGLYNWAQFEQLDADGQAGVIAHYRVHNKLESMINQHQSQQMEVQSKAKAAKGKGRR